MYFFAFINECIALWKMKPSHYNENKISPQFDLGKNNLMGNESGYIP